MKLLYLPAIGPLTEAKPRLFLACGCEIEDVVSVEACDVEGQSAVRLTVLVPEAPQQIDAPPVSADDAADARRLRWMLAGNGYFMEEEYLCGHEPCSEAEQNEARAKIDEAMRTDAIWNRPGQHDIEPPAQEPQAEPVAHLWQHGETGRTRVVMADQITDTDANWQCIGPLYAHPPQRKPLTDERIAEMACEEQFLLVCDDLAAITDITRAVERLHGITEAP